MRAHQYLVPVVYGILIALLLGFVFPFLRVVNLIAIVTSPLFPWDNPTSTDYVPLSLIVASAILLLGRGRLC